MYRGFIHLDDYWGEGAVFVDKTWYEEVMELIKKYPTIVLDTHSISSEDWERLYCSGKCIVVKDRPIVMICRDDWDTADEKLLMLLHEKINDIKTVPELMQKIKHLIEKKLVHSKLFRTAMKAKEILLREIGENYSLSVLYEFAKLCLELGIDYEKNEKAFRGLLAGWLTYKGVSPNKIDGKIASSYLRRKYRKIIWKHIEEQRKKHFI